MEKHLTDVGTPKETLAICLRKQGNIILSLVDELWRANIRRHKSKFRTAVTISWVFSLFWYFSLFFVAGKKERKVHCEDFSAKFFKNITLSVLNLNLLILRVFNKFEIQPWKNTGYWQ